MSTTAAVFAALAATLYAAHQVADHVLGQTDRQAAGKSRPGWDGWRHNLAHVAQYHLVVAAMVTAAVLALDLPVSPLGAAAGLGVSAATHAVIDRRWPVRRLLNSTGSAEFARQGDPDQPPVGLNGVYLADQALHYGCLWAAALLMTLMS